MARLAIAVSERVWAARGRWRVQKAAAVRSTAMVANHQVAGRQMWGLRVVPAAKAAAAQSRGWRGGFVAAGPGGLGVGGTEFQSLRLLDLPPCRKRRGEDGVLIFVLLPTAELPHSSQKKGLNGAPRLLLSGCALLPTSAKIVALSKSARHGRGVLLSLESGTRPHRRGRLCHATPSLPGTDSRSEQRP